MKIFTYYFHLKVISFKTMCEEREDCISPVEFIEKSKQYHLTIKDIMNMKEGEVLNIFFLDRNMFDHSCDERYNTIGEAVVPSRFFRNGYYIDFTKTTGIKGTWTWHYPGGTDKELEEREFDVDTGTIWYPLKNNTVPNRDSQGIFTIPIDFAGKHYTELDDSTRLGWRGPMMRKSDMDNLPSIVLKKDGQIN